MNYIKSIILVVFIATLASCGPSQVVKQSKKTLKGTWTLNEVSYDRQGTFNINLFNDASQECMEGSTWRFIPNNNFGNYELSGVGCDIEKRYFVWSIPDNEGDDMNYNILVKPTDAKMKSETNAGFRVALSYLSEDQLQMSQTVSVEGKPFNITMNFTKTAE